MRNWVIVGVYVTAVIATSGTLGWMYIVNRLSTWMPIAAAVVLVGAGFALSQALDTGPRAS